MPRPKRVYDPMTGLPDRRRSAPGAFPVPHVDDHAHRPVEDVAVMLWGERRVGRSANGHRHGLPDSIKGRRIA